MEYIIKKCMKCGAMVRVIKDCNCNGCGIKCCNEEMKELVSNSVDASIEKHVPEYEIKDDKLCIRVNHVMDNDHYIEWISVVYHNWEVVTYLNPGKKANFQCKYVSGSTIYAYCNKHGLWKKEVE